MAAETLTLDYFYDPLCGWCYASARALEAMAETYPQALTMRPSGLFANTDGQPISTMADHAWRNDQRIAQLTGQAVTTAYRDQILLNPDGLFDSVVATRAITALGDLDRALEPKLLHALQIARYVDAEDTVQPKVVAAIAVHVAAQNGHKLDQTALADRLANDQDLVRRTDARMHETVERMHGLPGSGVPRLLVTLGAHQEVVEGVDLYRNKASVLKTIDGVKARALAGAG